MSIFFSFLFFLSVITSSLFMSSLHPLVLALLLVMYSVLTSLILASFSFMWMFYIVILIFLGGMMVMFLYMTSFANENKIMLHLNFYFFFPFIFIALFNKLSSMESSVPQSPYSPLMKIFLTEMSGSLILFLTSYLLIILMVVVFMINVFKGSIISSTLKNNN